ncbi:MAG: hypothetical protein WCF84_06785 [Anaerolineae bacterium]
MWGIEAAVLFLTCLVSLIVLLTAPWWMRVVAALFGHVSSGLEEVDHDVQAQTVYPKEEK